MKERDSFPSNEKEKYKKALFLGSSTTMHGVSPSPERDEATFPLFCSGLLDPLGVLIS